MKRREALEAVAAVAAWGLLRVGAPLGALGVALGTPAAVATTSASDQGSGQALAALLRAGGCVLMLRHAQTEAGVGDPPGFTLGNCSTQRNLSDEGRAQSRRIGAWFQAQGLRPRAVQSSAWCRCIDTATLAFGSPQGLPALNSTFGTAGRQPAQTRALKALLAAIPAGQFDVWVTHQVHMTDLCGAYPGLGEGFVVSAQGALVARHVFS